MKRTHLGRRIVCMALVVMLLALTAAPALAAGAKDPKGVYVVMTKKGTRLNLRSASGSVKAKLPRGTVVYYRSQKNGWWYVTYRDGSGYVDRRYLWSVNNSQTAKYTPIYDNLYVRMQPQTNSPAIGKLSVGKKVTIVSQSSGWAKINYKGYTGWVSAKYLFRVS